MGLESVIPRLGRIGKSGKGAAGAGLGAAAVKGGADIIGDSIEGLGSAVGGALQGAGSAIGGALQGLGSAVGGALQGALTEGDKTIVNMGIVGSAAKQKVQRGGIATPPPRSETSANLPAVDENMPTKKLLVIAVKYLASIDNTLKSQLNYDKQLARNEAAAARERNIESDGLASGGLVGIGDSLKVRTTEKEGSNNSGLVSDLAKKFGILAAGAGVFALMGMNDAQFKRLENNVRKIKEAVTSDVIGTIIDVVSLIALVGGGKYLIRGGLKKIWNRVRGTTPRAIPATPPTSVPPGAGVSGGGMLVDGKYGSLRNGQNIGVGGTPFATTQSGTRAMSTLTQAEIRSLGQQGVVPRGIGYFDTQTNRMLTSPQVFEKVANAGRRMADITPQQAKLLKQAGYVGESGGVFWSKNGKPVPKEALFRDLATLERIQARGMMPRFLNFLKSARGNFLWSIGIDAALMAFGAQEPSARNIVGSITGAIGAGLAMAGASAATGAILGSVAPGLGNLAGGIIGGVVGFGAGILGYMFGRDLGERATDAITGTPPPDATRQQGPGVAATARPGYTNEYRSSGNFNKAAEVVAVLDAGAGYTTVQYKDGTIERREGTRASRNNNPGNIEFGDFARSQGAVGSDGRFAVFPTPNAGYQAMRALLSGERYGNLTVAQAITKWAPPSENDTQGYISSIQSLGIDVNQKFTDLTPQQQDLMMTGMAKKEGYYAQGSGPAMSGGSSFGSEAMALGKEGLETIIRGMREFISTDTVYDATPGSSHTPVQVGPMPDAKSVGEKTTSADSEKISKLAQEQIQTEADMVTGVKTENDKAAGAAAVGASQASSTAAAVRSANGGQIDVMNPNYKATGSIITTYMMFFGVKQSGETQ